MYVHILDVQLSGIMQQLAVLELYHIHEYCNRNTPHNVEFT